MYSAALCRGLIEAPTLHTQDLIGPKGIPRLYAAASLKLLWRNERATGSSSVFRGFMPRPH